MRVYRCTARLCPYFLTSPSQEEHGVARRPGFLPTRPWKQRAPGLQGLSGGSSPLQHPHPRSRCCPEKGRDAQPRLRLFPALSGGSAGRGPRMTGWNPAPHILPGDHARRSSGGALPCGAQAAMCSEWQGLAHLPPEELGPTCHPWCGNRARGAVGVRGTMQASCCLLQVAKWRPQGWWDWTEGSSVDCTQPPASKSRALRGTPSLTIPA